MECLLVLCWALAWQGETALPVPVLDEVLVQAEGRCECRAMRCGLGWGLGTREQPFVDSDRVGAEGGDC